jgi:glycosyltransferase involved in cell wall biosynthesis
VRQASCEYEKRNWIPTIAIPARNEATRLPLIISSLSKQTWVESGSQPLNITIVLNNCTDDSLEVASTTALRYPNLLVKLIETNFSANDAHVGSARRLAADEALASSPHPFDSVLLITDADAVPEPTWIENNLRAISAGADAVGGLILADESEVAQLGTKVRRRTALHLHYARLADELTALINPLPYDPWPRHQDHTGASLAVRAEIYRRVGGIPALPFREDIAFVARIRSAGYHLRHASDVRVRVSARLDGRAQNGMADCLKRWIKAERDGEAHLVESPQAVLARLLKRGHLRFLEESAWADCKGNAEQFGIAMAPGCSPGNAGRSPEEPDPIASVSIEAAIAQMEWMIRNVDELRGG